MNIQNEKQWTIAFIEACRTGSVEKLRHLCQKKYLNKGLADIHYHDEHGFRIACINGQVEIIKYLLTSPELKKEGHTFADLHARNEDGFRWACRNGRLDVVKYLLKSNELKETGHAFADEHACNDDGFRWACENERWDVIRWLVMDYELERTPDIEEISQQYPQSQEYFRVREELKELQSALKEESISGPISTQSISHQDSEYKKYERAAKKAKKL